MDNDRLLSKKPLWVVTPWQAVVFYKGDLVFKGCTISDGE